MNKRLLDLSGKIDESTVEPLEAVADVAEAANVPFFVVGATARDIILMHGYDIQTIRATYDIDLGVQVSDWSQYKKLREALIATGQFSTTREPQRLSYKESLNVDMVPFGTIAKPGSSVSWPPQHEVKMNTLAFEDSYRYSLTVRLKSDPIFDVQFASLAGLAAMKIISWDDNYPLRKKDAGDLSLTLQTYLDAGNQYRLFDEEADLVIEDFDYVLAGARLLGRDIAALSAPETREAVLAILNRETGEQGRYRLVEDMTVADRGVGSNDDFDERLQLLEWLKSGILDRP